MTAEEAIFSELERNPLIPAYTISMNKVLAADILAALAAAGYVVVRKEKTEDSLDARVERLETCVIRLMTWKATLST